MKTSTTTVRLWALPLFFYLLPVTVPFEVPVPEGKLPLEFEGWTFQLERPSAQVLRSPASWSFNHSGRTCRIQSGVEHRRKRQQNRKLLLENRELNKGLCESSQESNQTHTHTQRHLHPYTDTDTHTTESVACTNTPSRTLMHSCTYSLHKV